MTDNPNEDEFVIDVKIVFNKKSWDEMPEDIRNKIANDILVKQLQEFSRKINMLIIKHRYYAV